RVSSACRLRACPASSGRCPRRTSLSRTPCLPSLLNVAKTDITAICSAKAASMIECAFWDTNAIVSLYCHQGALQEIRLICKSGSRNGSKYRSVSACKDVFEHCHKGTKLYS